MNGETRQSQKTLASDDNLREEIEHPNIDADLRQELQEYDMKRRNDGLVRGTITEVSRASNYTKNIRVTVSTPSGEFSETFKKPSPETYRFEQLAEHYGVGLVDISALEGEDVWCDKKNGSWYIEINPHPTIRERLRRWYEDVASGDTLSNKVVVTLFGPLYAVDIMDTYQKSKRYTYLYDKPSSEKINWARGAVATAASFAFWMVFAAIILLVLL